MARDLKLGRVVSAQGGLASSLGFAAQYDAVQRMTGASTGRGSTEGGSQGVVLGRWSYAYLLTEHDKRCIDEGWPGSICGMPVADTNGGELTFAKTGTKFTCTVTVSEPELLPRPRHRWQVRKTPNS